MFVFLMTCTLFSWASAQDDIADVTSHELTVGGDQQQRYFLIGPAKDAEQPAGGYGLVVIMPGGDGSADFHPFVKRIFKHAMPEGYIVAQPVAAKWSDDQQIVWPTNETKTAEMTFSTERFVAAVIDDVAGQHKLDERRIFTLSWSSSGPAAYAISLTSKKVRGSLVAMSVFRPKYLPPLENAGGHRYFIYHSPDDRVCPFRMAQQAAAQLAEAGAATKLVTYDGGHGWRGNLYADIRSGIEWLESDEEETKTKSDAN